MALPMAQKPLCFLDVETTGLAEWEGHEPVEVAFIIEPAPGTKLIQRCLDGRRPVDLAEPITHFEGHFTPFPYRVSTERGTKLEEGECVVKRFSYLSKIKPQNLEVAEEKALEINGYAAHPEKWDHAPTFDEIAEALHEALKPCVLVGHNISFDVRFLRAAFIRAGIQPRFGYHLVDTVTLAYEHLLPAGVGRVSLDTVRKFLGWETEGAHTALKDTEDARRLYYRLLRATWRERLWWNLRGRWSK